jgi:hypothetical protein
MKNLFLFCLFVLGSFVSQAGIDQKVMSQVSEQNIESVVAVQKRNGYIPVWIDGFQHSTSVATNVGKKVTYFNVIFEKVPNPNSYTVKVANSLIVYPQGSYIQFLESYINGQGKVRFAMVIKNTGNNPNFKTFHGPSGNFQAFFNNMKAQGYHIENRNMVPVGNQWFTTARFEKSNVGAWLSKPNRTEAQATALMTDQRNKGRTLVHMDVPYKFPKKYNLIFHQKPTNNGWYAKNNLTKQQLNVAISNAKNQGYRTTIVCGYDIQWSINGNEVKQIRYAVTFVKPKNNGGFAIGG